MNSNIAVQRTSPEQIPELQELVYLLTKESQRIYGSAALEYIFNLVDYSALFHLLDYYQVDYLDYFNKESSMADYLTWSKLTVDKLAKFITAESSQPNSVLQKILSNVYSYLSGSKQLANTDYPADIIFVHGSSSRFRIDKAIDLYRSGYANHIFISGKGPIYSTKKQPEAENLAEYAIQNGVPIADIYLEKLSYSVSDNVKRSIDKIERERISVRKMILVSSPFALRRSHVNWMKFLASSQQVNIDVHSIASDTSSKYAEDKWFTALDSCKIVLNEYFKLYGEWLIDRDIINGVFYSQQ